jgi:hypothetical protein
MTTHPTTVELVEAVTLFIEGTVAPQLKDRDAFLARVAVNALGVIRRELESGAAAEGAATERLAVLLGRAGTYAELNAALCAALRVGEMGADTPGLLKHLRAETVDRVRIDQPKYAGLAAALEAR